MARIAFWQLRVHCPRPLLGALGWLAVLTLVFGTENLTAVQSAQLLEGFGPVCGLFLLAGLFGPETDRGLRDCVAVRRFPYLFVCGLRAGWLVLAAGLLAALCTAALALRGCAVQAAYGFAFWAGAVFLGGMALLCTVLLGGVVAGAVPPMAWFLLDQLSGTLGRWSLLLYSRGTGMAKSWVLGLGVLLLGAAFAAQGKKMQR